MNLKTVKLTSPHYLDKLPNKSSQKVYAFHSLEMEKTIQKLTQKMGIRAQFGGKYFCHDVHFIHLTRLPCHSASLPIRLGESCSTDHQALGKITKESILLEQLERDAA
ncbi:fumarate hydratase, class I [Bartonella sp. JB63]|nr:fumarate hydratase, class I [Bartonella sp. JB15]AQX29329.1 fumarate hydratase, class I [Bartonella sp. JB63]